MIYAIIILFVLVIYLFFTKQRKVKNDKLKQAIIANLGVRDELKLKVRIKEECRDLIRESQINSIIGKEDRLITLLN